MNQTPASSKATGSWLDPVIRFSLENKLIVTLTLFLMIGWGVMVAPFDWDVSHIPRDPVPVDAIPDLGENQQIVFTRWSGRSPRDIEDQISYPLTAALMGVPGIKTVRSYSYFGFSTIYLIFQEKVEFYWSRSRVLEKLNSLPANTLPDGVTPTLGPDATALGQIFWYTLEGRDQHGKPTAGWDRYELRKIQDWYVRYALQSAQGVAEVASIGGFVPQYQIDADPDKLRYHKLSLQQLYQAIRQANQEIGARTIEINRVEYVIRAKGYLKNISDIEDIVIKSQRGTPILVKDVARVAMGPAPRRGALDKDGAEVVGGVVVARYGANPLEVIKHVKAKIAELAPGLPRRRLKDGRISQVTLVPFYDRTHLIKETLHTLEEAISLEILVTILVVLAMLMHLRSSILISGLLPVSVLLCFVGMKLIGVDANIVALSGIAIAIGTMVDIGVVLSENIVQYLDELPPGESTLEAVFRATSEVGGAVVTAVSTTIVSFLPVFAMEAAEGKLFRPLAFTKTLALFASLVVSLWVLPPLAHSLFVKHRTPKERRFLSGVLLPWAVDLTLFTLGIAGFLADQLLWWAVLLLVGLAAYRMIWRVLSEGWQARIKTSMIYIVLVGTGAILTHQWMPLGVAKGTWRNLIFVGVLVGGLLLFFWLFRQMYARLLGWCLAHRYVFLSAPLALVLLGGSIWLGFDKMFGWIPTGLSYVGISEKVTRGSAPWIHLRHNVFPGLKKEFMPDLDEGSFLFMPTTMPHASMGEALDMLRKLDMAIRSVPEVSHVVGKIGRTESALDPAPISMVETVIHYRPKYRIDRSGKRILLWRPHIKTPKDIWNEIIKVTKLPGTTSAPFLQPIGARLVMLQSGMRAPMGIKIKGPDLNTIEKVALDLEKLLKKMPQISPATVLADRVVGKPYLEFHIDRKAIARYGLQLAQVQRVIQVAIGGAHITTTIEGRERYAVVLQYPRELRNDLQALQKIMVSTPKGIQIPLSQLATLKFTRGPQMIKSEDSFLVAYVVFDKQDGFGEIEVIEAAQRYLKQQIKLGKLEIPAGVSYHFAGSYQSQIRAEKRLLIVLPLALFLIFLILYLQFRSTWTTAFVFSGIVVAWAGGFLMIWLYGQPWFLNFSVFGSSMRDVFHIQPYLLSVAVWVGFIALFGIASDDGVVMTTYLEQCFERENPDSIESIREAVVLAGQRRIRPCLMTTATTILALLPILTSSGRGADIMIPMAIPSFGGMAIEVLTLFVVPVLYGWRQEWLWKRGQV